MNLFRKAVGLLEQATQSPQKTTRSFILTRSFRGYKQLPVVVYGDKESEKNNERLYNEELPGRTITFSPTQYANGQTMVFVAIDGLKVGTIFDADNIKRIDNITEVCAHKVIEHVKGGGKIATERHRVRLFAKEE